jgi:hypothetical protein
MIVLEGKHATWLRGLSPIIHAVKVLPADPMNPAPLELKGCGLMSETDETKIWETLREGVMDLRDLTTLGLPTLMSFAEFYDVEFVREHIRNKYFGTDIKAVAMALVHLDSPGLNLRPKSKLGYIASSAKLCGASTERLGEYLEKLSNRNDMILIFEYLVEESRKKRFTEHFGFLPIRDW